MTAVDVARWQFALTAGLHFVFVALTLGLAPLVAVMHTRYVLTGRAVHGRATRFWGQLYLINYGVGIITGLVMEFQFGLDWNGLSHFAGNVFGAPLALETLSAFFLESTFLGMWIFGWDRLPKYVHLALIWLVTVTAYVSAFWIMVANGFLQHPVGGQVEAGEFRLTDLAALTTNPEAIGGMAHLVAAAVQTGGLFVAGISAWHLARRTPEQRLFLGSLRLGLVVATVASALVINRGFAQFDYLALDQPGKVAVALGKGDPAAVQAALVARFGPGDYLPPSWLGVPATIMQNAGFAMGGIAVVALVLVLVGGRRAAASRWLLRPLSWVIPLPFAVVLLGWLVREEGRQPWVVYGYLRTADAVSPVTLPESLTSFVVFVGVLVVLAALNWSLIVRVARRGPGVDGLLGAPGGSDVDGPEPGAGDASTAAVL